MILPPKVSPMGSRSLAEHAEGRPAIAAPQGRQFARRDERPTSRWPLDGTGRIRNPFTILPVGFVASDRTAGPTADISE